MQTFSTRVLAVSIACAMFSGGAASAQTSNSPEQPEESSRAGLGGVSVGGTLDFVDVVKLTVDGRSDRDSTVFDRLGAVFTGRFAGTDFMFVAASLAVATNLGNDTKVYTLLPRLEFTASTLGPGEGWAGPAVGTRLFRSGGFDPVKANLAVFGFVAGYRGFVSDTVALGTELRALGYKGPVKSSLANGSMRGFVASWTVLNLSWWPSRPAVEAESESQDQGRRFVH